MSGRIRLDAEPPSETQEPPQPEPQPPPPPEPRPEPEPEPTPEIPPRPEAAQEPEQPLPAEVKKRIDRLTWEKYEARRQLEEYQRQVQAVAQQQRAMQTGGQADPEERALNRFRAEAAERDFNARCNEVFQRGSQEYGDFPEAVRALNAVGYGNRPDALAAIASMPEGHRVYRHLASDLDNAARVLALPPMQMAMELARIAHASAPAANGNAEPPHVSRAPAPIRPIGGTARAPDKPLDKMTMAEFIRRRDADELGSSRIRR